MQTYQKPFNNQKSRAIITGIVEVNLSQSIWKIIMAIKKKHHRLTFSWITRYCIFKLLKDKGFYKDSKYLQLQKELKNQKKLPKSQPKETHKHKVCFYGNDEVYLKQLSAQLRLPMAKMIRIALLMYLPELVAEFLEEESSENNSEVDEKNIDIFLELFEKVKASGTKVIKTIDFVWKKVKYEYEDKLEFNFFLFFPQEIF